MTSSDTFANSRHPFRRWPSPVRLTQAGITELVVYERNGDVGGVWRDNAYPGAACDVPSHLYSLSFAPKPDWSRRYAPVAPQEEIHQYLRDVARDFDVVRRVRLNTEVLAARFDDETGRWTLQLSDGTTAEADVFIAATRQLSRPARPAVPGRSFRGAMFHSAEWDPAHDFEGTRVAVIGTGASAIQFVPRIAPETAHLTVFQRSAPYVLPKRDHPYRQTTKDALTRVPALLAASRYANYWSNEFRSLGFNTEPRLLAGLQLRFKRYLDKTVTYPAHRAKVTPDDPIGMQAHSHQQRVIASPAAAAGRGLQRADPRGAGKRGAHRRRAPARGRHHRPGHRLRRHPVPRPHARHRPRRRRPARAVGRRRPRSPRHHRARLPNMFVLYGPNTNLGHNSIIFMIEAQVGYVVQAVEHLRRSGDRWIDVRPDIAEVFDGWVQDKVRSTVFAGSCRGWYLTSDGRNTQNCPASTLTFRRRLRQLRLEDFERSPGRDVDRGRRSRPRPRPPTGAIVTSPVVRSGGRALLSSG